MPTKPEIFGRKKTNGGQQFKIKKEVKDKRSSCAAGYGYRWQKLRSHVLRLNPVCVICMRKPAHHVDHIQAKSDGGTDAMDNLQGLCHSCHSRKTVAHDGGLGRPKVRL